MNSSIIEPSNNLTYESYILREARVKVLDKLNISLDYDSSWNCIGTPYNDIDKMNSELELVLKEFYFEILRKKRNELLKQCDYLALPDYPHENPEIRTAWKIYRQQLRDLPNNNESIKDMELDEYDELIGVVWPTPPA
tara:strand:- start:524 stop:937 length:414 start_codon:yes stop_codon:yes gene_type:complete